MIRARSISHAGLATVLITALGLLATPLEATEAVDDGQAHDAEAPDAHAEADEDAAHAEHSEAGEFAGHHVHAEHRNGLGVYLGGTRVTVGPGAIEEDKTFFTFGLEYERLLADRWAVQLVVEHVDTYDAWVVVAPVGFRLGSTLWALAGPGLESEARRAPQEDGIPEPAPHGAGHSAEPHEEEGPFFLWRFGLTYGIHLGESGRISLFPSVNLDLVREHGEWEKAWVLGVGVSYHF